MASACCSPIADGYPYGSIFELGMESSKPSASSNAQPLSLAAWLKPSEVEAPASTLTDDRRFRLAPPIGRSGRTANLCDDEGFPFLREFLPYPKQVIDLTLDSDEDDDDDDDAVETASTLSPNSLRFSPSSLRKPPSHTADDLTTSTIVATPGRKSYPWKNVPRWSKLYHKLQQHSATPLHNQPTVEAGTDNLESVSTEFERPPKDFRDLVAERPENSPEIPETPTVANDHSDDDHSDDDDGDHNEGTQTVISASMIANGDDSKVDRRSSFIRNRPHNEYDTGSAETDNLPNTDQTDLITSTNSSSEAHLSIARFSEQTLALMTVSASSLSDVGEDRLTIVDISKLTMVKILDKRSSSSGIEYQCEFGPLWLAADLAERAQMGRVHIRSYENGLIRDRRLKTLRVGKRKFSEM